MRYILSLICLYFNYEFYLGETFEDIWIKDKTARDENNVETIDEFLQESSKKQPRKGYSRILWQSYSLEPQFSLKKMDGDKFSYQCNLCKPKVKMIAAHLRSRFNLKRHLSTQHANRDVDNFEENIRKK